MSAKRANFSTRNPLIPFMLVAIVAGAFSVTAIQLVMSQPASYQPAVLGQMDPSNYQPTILMNPSKQDLPSNTTQEMTFYIDTLGVPISQADVIIKLASTPWPKSGFSFIDLHSKPAFTLVSHYFQQVDDANTQELHLSFKSTSQTGFNAGSEQVPLVTISYTSEPGQLITATILSDASKIYDLAGQSIPFANYGANSYTYQTMLAVASTPIPTRPASPTASVYPTRPTPSPSITPKPTAIDPHQVQIEQLQQKVDSLSQQVQAEKQANQEVQSRLSILERIIQSIKSFFKF